MNKLYVNLENCFGIGKFEYEFDFTNTNTLLIYAPNGTMKTSFAKTFECISANEKKEKPSDQIYLKRETVYLIKNDDKSINPESILVINSENINFDASSKISKFIASKELKKQYDDIYSTLNDLKSEFIKKLKATSQSSDCESEIISTFKNNDKDDLFLILSQIIGNLSEKYEKYEFRYNDIFDKNNKVSLFLEKHKELLSQYIKNYLELLSKSKFFNKSDNTFGTIQANNMIRSFEDNSFFDAGHKLVLKGNENISSSQELKELVEDELNSIISDSSLKQTFDKVDKAIGANAELRAFQKEIEKNNLLLVELNNYSEFRKKVWFSYLSEIKKEVADLVSIYLQKKTELEDIINKAANETMLWEEIISLFNSRFYVPFIVKLTNQEDIILKQQTANIEFEYKDTSTSKTTITDKSLLLNILSKGEQRAYFILQFLFDIESRKSEQENLLIIDDIEDSFDYKNKYAIIEYLKDLNDLNNFKSIILTHNFDFFRTLSNRLEIQKYAFMTTKDDKREIQLHPGQYLKSVFSFFSDKLDNPKIFICSIPFVRNLIEYTDGEENTEYLVLTKCLHIKNESNKITCKDVSEIYKSRINKCNIDTIKFKDNNIIDFIINTAEDIEKEQNIDEIKLENKIVLSIAIRLLAEKHMISKITSFDDTKVTSNQTRVLYNEYKKLGNKVNDQILDKVNLMTPENLHVNAFMYEPLIDMSVNHLLSLFNQVSDLK